MNISVQVGTSDGNLHALMEWDAPDVSAYYTVEWGRRACRVQEVLPPCDLTDTNYVSVVESDVSEVLNSF